MNLNHNVIDRCRWLGSLRHLHPGGARRPVRHHYCLHRHRLLILSVYGERSTWTETPWPSRYAADLLRSRLCKLVTVDAAAPKPNPIDMKLRSFIILAGVGACVTM